MVCSGRVNHVMRARRERGVKQPRGFINDVRGGRRAFPSFLSCILAWRRWVSAVLRYGGELVREHVVGFPRLPSFPIRFE